MYSALVPSRAGLPATTTRSPGLSVSAVMPTAEATAEAIRKIAEAIQHPGGEQAVQLKVAEKAVEAYGQLAQKNNTMIVPGNMSEVSALIGTAMTLLKKAPPAP